MIWKRSNTKSALSSDVFLGLCVGKNKIAFVVLDHSKENEIRIVKQGSVDYASDSLLEKTLQDLQEKEHLENIRCRLVLCADDYQLILINKPKVLESEYRAAALWQIKELISFPMTDCVIDVFLPADIIIPHQGKLYVVAVKQSFLSRIVDALTAVNISVESVITQEFAIRDTVSLLYEKNKTIGVLSRSDHAYFLTVLKEGGILLSRKMSTMLTSELKDSFEFFTSALKQEPISTLLTIDIPLPERNQLELFLQPFESPVALMDLIKYIQPMISTQLTLPSVEMIYALGGSLPSPFLKENTHVNTAN